MKLVVFVLIFSFLSCLNELEEKQKKGSAEKGVLFLKQQ